VGAGTHAHTQSQAQAQTVLAHSCPPAGRITTLALHMCVGVWFVRACVAERRHSHRAHAQVQAWGQGVYMGTGMHKHIDMYCRGLYVYVPLCFSVFLLFLILPSLVGPQPLVVGHSALSACTDQSSHLWWLTPLLWGLNSTCEELGFVLQMSLCVPSHGFHAWAFHRYYTCSPSQGLHGRAFHR
jgi:hypothetical protein